MSHLEILWLYQLQHFLTVFCVNQRAGLLWGRDSSVSIATRYGLVGPGIESRWGEIFRIRPDWPWVPPSLVYSGYQVFRVAFVACSRLNFIFGVCCTQVHFRHWSGKLKVKWTKIKVRQVEVQLCNDVYRSSIVQSHVVWLTAFV
jgi:hypothetical protein